jgi:hypothetical protein
MLKRAAAALLVALAVPSGTSAQQQIEDPEAVFVEELVVRGRLPGPAWWRVSDADSVVYVLGLPEALPKGMSWDQSVLQRRLDGANLLLTPPVLQASASPLAVPGLIVSARRAMGEEAAPGEGLTEEQSSRLNAAAVSAGLPPERYAGLRPWMAGVRFVSDHRKRMRLDAGEPLKSIQRAAARARVKSRPAAARELSVKAIIAEVKRIPPQAGRQCFDDALAEAEQTALTREAAAAWASGDARSALDAPRSSESCLTVIPGAASEIRSLHRQQAEAIARALDRPGRAVAALTLRSLLAEGGTLDQLRAQGFDVQTPGSRD